MQSKATWGRRRHGFHEEKRERFMMKICPLCRTNAEISDGSPLEEDNTGREFVQCPVCGRYDYSKVWNELEEFNKDHLMSYLVYNGIHRNEDYRYYTTKPKEWCDKWREEFDHGNIKHGRPIHLTSEIVENWYPKTIAERVDFILKYIADNASHMGSFIQYNDNRMYGALFVELYEDYGKKLSLDGAEDQASFIVNYLLAEGYIRTEGYDGKFLPYVSIALTPKGYSKVEELERSNSKGREVLVAMKFGSETIALRAAIKKGIADAGYIPILIDEVQHNDFITPELLSHIRNSKFVVVDLTHKNNGAYFEEGYAMGYGKQVIQLCKERVRLHFDIAQKNTIIWKTESEIPEKLKNRILATID